MRRRQRDEAPGASPGKLLVSVEEAAQALSLGRTVVYELVNRRHLASIKVGRARRIPVAALHAFILARQSPGDPLDESEPESEREA